MTVLDDRLAALHAAARAPVVAGRGLGAVALEAAAAEPDRVAVVQGAHTLTRGALLDLALRLGGALRARGIGPGAAVAFQLPNWWEACVVNLAACLYGYRLVPLLPIYRAAELGFILPAADVKAVFVPAQHRGTAYPALVAALPAPPRHVLTVRGDPAAADAFERLVAGPPAEPELPPDDDAKLVIFTSGSTGRPKGVIHAHAAFDALIRRTAAFWGIDGDDRLYVPSPIGHIGGSIYAFEFPWITGCTAVLAERWDADEAVLAIDGGGAPDGAGATFMAGATPFLSGLLAASERAGSRLASLRRFICGGASVPPELVRRALTRFEGAVVSRAYGSTEVPLVCPGIRDRSEAEIRADTDGECAIELALLAADGRPAAEGAAGEIAVRGPQMLLGYLDPADEAGSFTPDGRFRMGDLGRRVDGRFIEITGRVKDIIIRKGENISPLEVESALARHPGVRQAAVVGVPDRERGELVAAFVVPAAEGAFGFAEMTAHLDRLGLARQKFPERLVLVADLPLNTVGKVRKDALRQAAAAGITS